MSHKLFWHQGAGCFRRRQGRRHGLQSLRYHGEIKGGLRALEEDPANPILTSVPGESFERCDPDHLKPKYYNPDSILQKSGHGSYVELLTGEELGNFYYAPRIMPERFADLKARPGYVRIRGQESRTSLNKVSILARKLTSVQARVTTKMEFTPETHQHSAGLILYYDNMNYIYLRKYHSETLGRVRYHQVFRRILQVWGIYWNHGGAHLRGSGKT